MVRIDPGVGGTPNFSNYASRDGNKFDPPPPPQIEKY